MARTLLEMMILHGQLLSEQKFIYVQLNKGNTHTHTHTRKKRKKKIKLIIFIMEFIETISHRFSVCFVIMCYLLMYCMLSIPPPLNHSVSSSSAKVHLISLFLHEFFLQLNTTNIDIYMTISLKLSIFCTNF